MLNVFKKRLLAIASITAAVAAFGQLRPDTSITKFSMPLFDEVGYREWQLEGELATYKSETQINIEGMKVSQFTVDEENREIATLSSPEAIFHFDSTTAYGPGVLTVESDAFKVVGSDWIWIGKQKQITLNRDVKVTLYEEIGDILK